MTTTRIEEMVEEIYNAVNGLPSKAHERIIEALTQAHQTGVDEAVEKINKKYWLNPKRSKKDTAKDNAWNDLGNTLRNGV